MTPIRKTRFDPARRAAARSRRPCGIGSVPRPDPRRAGRRHARRSQEARRTRHRHRNAVSAFRYFGQRDYKGVDRDLIDEVGKELGVKVKYLDLPWTSILPGLEAKKFDICIAPVTITKERMKRYLFTVPIADATAALMKRANDASIAKPEDIAGKTVGGQKGTSQLAQLKAYAAKLSKPVEVKEYVDNNQSYADLAAGRIDASVNSFPNLAYAAAQRADTFAVVTPAFGTPTYFSWVGRLDDKALIDAVNAAILKT